MSSLLGDLGWARGIDPAFDQRLDDADYSGPKPADPDRHEPDYLEDEHEC